jgi:hypothetical protein
MIAVIQIYYDKAKEIAGLPEHDWDSRLDEYIRFHRKYYSILYKIIEKYDYDELN